MKNNAQLLAEVAQAQLLLAEQVCRGLGIAEMFEVRHTDAKDEVGDLDSSILAKAFRGELVPQDPNDEPASVLLERICKEREGGDAKKTRKRKVQ